MQNERGKKDFYPKTFVSGNSSIDRFMAIRADLFIELTLTRLG